jgi:hypothetical protein
MDSKGYNERELLRYAHPEPGDSGLQIYLSTADEVVVKFNGHGVSNKKRIRDYVPGSDLDRSHDLHESFPYYITPSRFALSRDRGIRLQYEKDSLHQEPYVHRYGQGIQASSLWLKTHVPIKITL